MAMNRPELSRFMKYSKRAHLLKAPLVIFQGKTRTTSCTHAFPQVSNLMTSVKNVLGSDLQPCSMEPRTGFYRNGCCHTGREDAGLHIVCVLLTEDFLRFSQGRGNDLITPRPEYDFPGLQPGDRWCLCVERWREAQEAGAAPPVVLEATHISTLEYVSMADLLAHSIDA